MATKNFKNNGVCGIVKNFGAGVWTIATLIGGVIAGIGAAVLWTAVCLVGLIISPLWFPVCCIKAPEATAISINSSFSKHKGEGLLNYFYLIYLLLIRACGWLYAPLIKVLPMKYRAEFIRNGKKRVCEYPVKTQVAYYKSHCNGSKQSLLSSAVFSAEAREAIWQDKDERINFIDAGLPLTEEMVRELCSKGANTSLLCRYFKKNTPSKSVMNILIDMARKGYSTSQEVLLYLIRQQRPDAALVGRLLTIDQKFFDERVKEILDEYADIDAATYTSDSEEDVLVRWSNFCKGKKEISPKAQKYMNHKQYKIYVDTRHNLDFYVLQHLLLSIAEEDYLKDVVEDEFDNIKDKMLLALKAEYWRYSVYLAVKEAKSILPSKKH